MYKGMQGCLTTGQFCTQILSSSEQEMDLPHATFQLPGVETWLVVSFPLTLVLLTYHMQIKVK